MLPRSAATSTLLTGWDSGCRSCSHAPAAHPRTAVDTPTSTRICSKHSRAAAVPPSTTHRPEHPRTAAVAPTFQPVLRDRQHDISYHARDIVITNVNPVYNCLPAYRRSSPRASPHGSTGTVMIISHSIPADPLPVVINIVSRTAIATLLDITVLYEIRFTHYTCSMTSTPSVCLADIEQCSNRPPKTIAAHLPNITISSSSSSYYRERRVLVFVELREFEKLTKSTFGTGRKQLPSSSQDLDKYHKIRVATVTSLILVLKDMDSFLK